MLVVQMLLPRFLVLEVLLFFHLLQQSHGLLKRHWRSGEVSAQGASSEVSVQAASDGNDETASDGGPMTDPVFNHSLVMLVNQPSLETAFTSSRASIKASNQSSRVSGPPTESVHPVHVLRAAQSNLSETKTRRTIQSPDKQDAMRPIAGNDDVTTRKRGLSSDVTTNKALQFVRDSSDNVVAGRDHENGSLLLPGDQLKEHSSIQPGHGSPVIREKAVQTGSDISKCSLMGGSSAGECCSMAKNVTQCNCESGQWLFIPDENTCVKPRRGGKRLMFKDANSLSPNHRHMQMSSIVKPVETSCSKFWRSKNFRFCFVCSGSKMITPNLCALRINNCKNREATTKANIDNHANDGDNNTKNCEQIGWSKKYLSPEGLSKRYLSPDLKAELNQKSVIFNTSSLFQMEFPTGNIKSLVKLSSFTGETKSLTI